MTVSTHKCIRCGVYHNNVLGYCGNCERELQEIEELNQESEEN